MSALKPLAAAGVLLVGTVSALVYFGRHDAAGSTRAASTDAAPKSATSSAPIQAAQPSAPAPVGSGIVHSARSLIPKEAWLVADFRGDLTGTRPFEDQTGLCKEVPAPPRVALGILPPLATSKGGPEMMLAAPEVSDTFWGCARDRIIVAGGTVLAQNDQFDVLKSPSGVVARGPSKAMIFLSNEGYLERSLSVMAQLGESAASTGVHAGLFRRMHADQVPPDTSLDLTIFVPSDWLASVGEEAKLSPLRHLQAAFLSAHEDGRAQGGVDCAEPGCQELYQFLSSAKGDLLAQLPGPKAAVVKSALGVDYVAQSGRVVVSWSPTAGRIQDLFGGLFSGSRLFGP